MYVIARPVRLRFERVRSVGALRTRRLHGDECRFRSRLTNLSFNGYFLKLTRRRDESGAPFFLKILEKF